MSKKAFCFVLQTISQKKGSWGWTPGFWAGTYERWCLVDRSWCTRSRLCIGDVSGQSVGMDFECESGSMRTACNPQIWSYFRVGNDHEVRHSQWWGYMHKIPHCVLVWFLSHQLWWQSSTHKFNKSFSKRNSHKIQREDPLDCWISKTSIPLPLHDWHSEEAPTDPEGDLAGQTLKPLSLSLKKKKKKISDLEVHGSVWHHELAKIMSKVLKRWWKLSSAEDKALGHFVFR